MPSPSQLQQEVARKTPTPGPEEFGLPSRKESRWRVAERQGRKARKNEQRKV